MIEYDISGVKVDNQGVSLGFVPEIDFIGSGVTAARVGNKVNVTIPGSGPAYSFTPGSVIFAGATGNLFEDNANFFFDDTNNYLGIGTNTPGAKLQVVSNTNSFFASAVFSNPNTGSSAVSSIIINGDGVDGVDIGILGTNCTDFPTYGNKNTSHLYVGNSLDGFNFLVGTSGLGDRYIRFYPGITADDSSGSVLSLIQSRYVGINKNVPVASLDVYSSGNDATTYTAIFSSLLGQTLSLRDDNRLIYTDGNQASGKVLTSDANGVATWQTSSTGIGGSGTVNYIPKFTAGTTLGNGSWGFSTNTIYPITDGSNIGLTGTNRVGTIFMSSTIDYAANLIFSESGVEKGRFLTGGNFGVGTAVPTSGIHLKKTINDALSCAITAENNSAGITAVAQVYAINNTGVFGGCYVRSSSYSGTLFGLTAANLASYHSNGDNVVYGSSANSPVSIISNSIIRMTVLGSGLVGINKTIPTSSLEAVGVGVTSATYVLKLHNSTGTSNSLVVRNDGFVGIGALPLSDLYVVKTDNASNSIITAYSNNLSSGVALNYKGVFMVGSTTDLNLELLPQGSGNVYINTHNLAIGSTTSNSRVYVVKDDNGTGAIISALTNNLSAGMALTWKGLQVIGSNTDVDLHLIPKGAGNLLVDSGNVGINGVTTFGTSSVGVFAQANGTAPTTDIANQYQMYSIDVTAGNAAPQFRTEAGNLITLFSGAALTTTLTSLTQAGAFTPDYAIQALTNIAPYGFATLDEAETTLSVILNLQARVNQLEARLQANGLIL